VMLLILNLPLVGMWAKIVRIPFYILGPMIVFCAVIGTYSLRFQVFDIWMMTLFGVIGYFMRKFGFPVAPMVLSSVLAQMLETALGQALLISQGSPPEVVTDDAEY
jgi:putative tricarboxylic transport membrane protein